MPTERCVNLEFSYDAKYRTDIEPGHWFDVYTDVVLLQTGECIGQLSIQYDFTPPSSATKHKPAFAIYFETADGDIHDVSKETQNVMHSPQSQSQSQSQN